MLYVMKVSSITNAQRAVSLLSKYGIKCKIGRVKNPKKGDGCGYTVELRTNDIRLVYQLLKDYGIRMTGVEEG